VLDSAIAASLPLPLLWHQVQLGAPEGCPFYFVLAHYYGSPRGSDTAIAVMHLLQVCCPSWCSLQCWFCVCMHVCIYVCMHVGGKGGL